MRCGLSQASPLTSEPAPSSGLPYAGEPPGGLFIGSLPVTRYPLCEAASIPKVHVIGNAFTFALIVLYLLAQRRKHPVTTGHYSDSRSTATMSGRSLTSIASCVFKSTRRRDSTCSTPVASGRNSISVSKQAAAANGLFPNVSSGTEASCRGIRTLF